MPFIFTFFPFATAARVSIFCFSGRFAAPPHPQNAPESRVTQPPLRLSPGKLGRRGPTNAFPCTVLQSEIIGAKSANQAKRSKRPETRKRPAPVASMPMKKVAVTGGAGRLGRYIVDEFLASG